MMMREGQEEEERWTREEEGRSRADGSCSWLIERLIWWEQTRGRWREGERASHILRMHVHLLMTEL